jgi:RNA polymerase sigma factor (sigma-70 family)
VAGELLGDVLRRLGRWAGLQGDLSQPDAQLLERFVRRRDEPAFAALVVRHGPMVLSVCRRLLRDTQEAEDAFQATFLVLARKAGGLRWHPPLGPWLYGVAYRVATRQRGRACRRQAREQAGADLDALPAAAPAPADDVAAVHEEVRRLPERYRAPVVLCYLQGKTNEEAAGELGCPVGTVKGRLARARDLLRSRLARRGLAALAGVLAAAPAAEAAPGLFDATVQAAARFAAGDAAAGGFASAQAVALSKGVLRTMTLVKLKLAAVLMLAAVVATGTGLLAYRALAKEPPAAGKDEKPAAKGADKKEDKDLIQGTWKVVNLLREGEEQNDQEAKEMKGAKWVIGAGKLTLRLEGQADRESTYTLDPTAKPKAIDVTSLERGEKDRKFEGVYELDGDTLKICVSTPLGGPQRPKKVAAEKGDGTVLLVLKREKAKDGK